MEVSRVGSKVVNVDIRLTSGTFRVALGSWDVRWDGQSERGVQAREEDSKLPRFCILRDCVPRRQDSEQETTRSRRRRTFTSDCKTKHKSTLTS